MTTFRPVRHWTWRTRWPIWREVIGSSPGTARTAWSCRDRGRRSLLVLSSPTPVFRHGFRLRAARDPGSWRGSGRNPPLRSTAAPGLRGDDEGVRRSSGASRRPVGGRRGDAWDEARWEGKPGERSLWSVTASSRQSQRVVRVVLKGPRAVRQYQPYAIAILWRRMLEVVKVPISYLRGLEERGTAWQKFAERALSFGDGVATIVR